MNHSAEPSEDEIDAVIEEFGGDLRATIRALLHDIAVLSADYAATVSRGYIRRKAQALEASHKDPRATDERASGR